MPDYNVSVAELLIPASELSQHIRYLSFNISSNQNAPIHHNTVIFFFWIKSGINLTNFIEKDKRVF